MITEFFLAGNNRALQTWGNSLAAGKSGTVTANKIFLYFLPSHLEGQWGPGWDINL